MVIDHVKLEHNETLLPNAPLAADTMCLDKSYYLPESKHLILNGLSLSPAVDASSDEGGSIYERLGYLRLSSDVYQELRY